MYFPRLPSFTCARSFLFVTFSFDNAFLAFTLETGKLTGGPLVTTALPDMLLYCTACEVNSLLGHVESCVQKNKAWDKSYACFEHSFLASEHYFPQKHAGSRMPGSVKWPD